MLWNTVISGWQPLNLIYGAGAVGGQGLGHAAALGAALGPAGIGLGLDPEGLEADPGTAAVPIASLGEAVAEAGARVGVGAAARVEANPRIEAEAARSAVSLNEVGLSREGIAAQNREVGVDQGITADPNQRNGAEADTEVHLRNAAVASTAAVPSQKSLAKASITAVRGPRSAADPSPWSAAGASGAVGRSQRSAAAANTAAGQSLRRGGAGASLTGVAAEAERKVSSEIGATAPR